MIPVSNNLKKAVLNEEKPKNMSVYPFLDDAYSELNWFGSEYSPTETLSGTYTSGVIGATCPILSGGDFVDTLISDYDGYIIISFDVYMSSDNVTSGDVSLSIRIYFKDSNGTRHEIMSDSHNYCRLHNGGVRYYFWANVYDLRNNDFDKFDSMIDFRFFGQTPVNYNLTFTRPHIYFADNSYKKEYSDAFATPENIKKYITDVSFDTIGNDKIIGESFSFEESICSAENLKLGGCESAKCEISILNPTHDFAGDCITTAMNINNKGTFYFSKFNVQKSEKSAKGVLNVRTITAYDKMHNLTQNAFSWYSQYMFGVNMTRETQYRNYHFDFERQIYATYHNLARTFGLEPPIDMSKASRVSTFATYEYPSTDFYLKFTEETGSLDRVKFCKKRIQKLNDRRIYFVDFRVIDTFPYYKRDFDSLGRGINGIATVYVNFLDSNGDDLGFGGLFDRLDYILLPPDCTQFDLYIPYTCTNSAMQDSVYISIGGVEVYSMTNTYAGIDYNVENIVNAYLPLPYYSYVWRKPTVDNIFTAQSSITARDVMRSLMEMCGCFYRMSRDGKPQMIYASEHGLYPENTLYPANDLFPKKSGELTMPTGYYFTADFAEYKVEKFGGVQVVVNAKNNTGAVCRWEYWDDDTSDSAYLIDDNIFLCAEEFDYEPENTGDIDTLLQNLFSCLDNLQYTPFQVEAVGTPFLESGDRFTLITHNDGFESFIFERKLKGIQALRDYFEARGIQKTPRVKNFEWEQ